MNNKDKIAWTEKTKKLNTNIDLMIGMKVIDINKNNGIVVKIIKPENSELSVENHGTVYVWQSDKVGFGADNCEHYTYLSWNSFLRVIE